MRLLPLGLELPAIFVFFFGTSRINEYGVHCAKLLHRLNAQRVQVFHF